MNLNDDDFANSDAWLSEQLFAQLKDFNADYKSRGNIFPMTDSLQNCDGIATANGITTLLDDDNLQPQDLSKSSLQLFDADFQRHTSVGAVDMYNLNAPIDLSNSTLKSLSTKPVNLSTMVPLGNAPVVGAAAVVNEAARQNIPPTFDATEEEMKLLRFLESHPKETRMDTKVYSPSELPSTDYHIVKCANCSCLFDIISFQSHVCDYDEHHNLIVPPVPTVAPSSTVKCIREEPLLPLEPACIRLLKENQIRIRRFLKDELKYDINATIFGGGGGTGSTTSNQMGSLCNPGQGPTSSTSATVHNTSSGNKKQEGPHECTLCERKFVHASGLLRHMEKHALDLIPTPNVNGNNKAAASQGNSIQSVNGLRVVVKCTLCGRIFFEPFAFFSHLTRHHFSISDADEQELDNCAEIPYESYVDDALNFLRNEAENSGDGRNSYHGEKQLSYFKMVILSCVLQCEFCDFVFSEVSYLFVHSACHSPERRFECFACGIYVRTTKEICTHWQAECVFMRENLKVNQATTVRYFVCNVCENKFQSLDQLHEHRYTSYHFFPRLNKRLGILQLPCEYCDTVCETAHDCVVHYEERHYKKYRRDKDGVSNSNKSRQYLCDICGKSYTQSSHLWQHLRFHQGVKPFACKEPGCTRKFTIRPDLNDHIRKCHTGERPYHCLVCGKRFLTGSVFYQHRLIHRGERRYECEECGKRFYRADALKNHQRIHTGEKPFGCLFCTKNFRQRGDRDKHIRARHSHLDANARLMMQMQKLQLEAAAAVAAAAQAKTSQQKQQQEQKQQEQDMIPNNQENTPPKRSNDSTAEAANEANNVIMIGNVAFPKSLFESILPDIDEEATLKALRQMQ